MDTTKQTIATSIMRAIAPAPFLDVAGATSRNPSPQHTTAAYACLKLPASQGPAGTASSKLVAIADGSSGPAGRFASHLALDSLTKYISAYPPWTTAADDVKGMRSLVSRAFRACQRQLRQAEGPHIPDPAASVTAIYIRWPDAVIAHAGSTRAYLYRKGILRQQTWDHTLAAEMSRRQLPFADVGDAADVVINLVGGGDEDLRIDIKHLRLEADDQLLLTSAGLHDSSSCGKMARCLRDAITAAGACRRLLSLSNDESATVAVARLMPM